MSINYASSLNEVGTAAERTSVNTQMTKAAPATAAFSAEVIDEGGWVKDNRYEWYDDYFDNTLSLIDENKTITLGKGQINLTQEENSQFIQFQMPKKYDGFDLAKTLLSIHFDNANGGHGADPAINVEYNENENKIRFGWLIDGDVTCVPGKIVFSVHADGINSKGNAYRWKTKSCDAITIDKDLCISCDDIVLDDSWVQELVTRLAESVTEEIAQAQVGAQVAVAEKAAEDAQGFAEQAQQAAEAAGTTASEAIGAILVDYPTKHELQTAIDGVDVSEQLKDYALKTEMPTKVSALENDAGYLTEHQNLEAYALKTELPVVPEKITAFENDAGYLTEHQSLEAYALKNEIPSIEGLASEEYVQQAVAAADISDKLAEYAKQENVYTKDEVDEALTHVQVDLSDYYKKSEVDDKDKAISDSVAANTSSVASLNRAVADINQTLENMDDSPKVTYDATYGDVELDDGSTAKDMFTLWKTEGGVREIQDRFQITGGGGGNTSSVTLRIAYVDGYGTPFVATASDPVILKYSFTGEDSAGDTNLDGIASWKIGNRVVATQDVATGEREFDLTEYMATGDNKVVLTITHATGAMATKAWTVKVVDVRLESTFNDTKTVTANQPVTFAFTPYGGVDKTVHFLLDGKEIGTKISAASAAGLSDSFNIPAQEHGSHLFEIYMTATINEKEIESNHIIKDILWYDAAQGLAVIGCAKQKFTIRQHEAINLEYTVYDPSTETPEVTLKSTYVNEDGDIVEEYLSDITMLSNTGIWQYKTDVLGEHILTITCGEVVKTLVVTIVALGIEIAPITAGLVFDFNPVGYSNNDSNRLWSNGDISMSVSDNFDWVNGGYQYDENGDQCFIVKAGTSAEINYELFGDDAKANGKEVKLIFKTKNVSDSETTFLSCISDTIGTDKIGLEMKAHEATIYAKTDSLPLPYAEEEVVEFEFNITSNSEVPSMLMGYEDGVSTRPLVYDDTHDFQQYQGYRKIIKLGSNDCDLCIYRFKVYSNSLSDRDILNNFIADARSADEMIRRHDRNQIYKEGVLDPDYLAEVCPDLRIIKLEVPHFTKDKDDKVYDSKIQSIVECVYKGGDPVYDNWVAYDIVHSGQGTSSNNYGPAGRNLDIIIKSYKDYGNNPYIILGDGSQTNKVALTRESIPTNYFNVKVNIASSENANNAVLQKRYDRYNPYKRPCVREDASIIPYIKDTMEFQNCVIFLKESDTDLSTHVEFNDNLWHLYAIGNIGDSKKTDDTRLTDPSDPYECILEVMDNTLPNSTMPTGKVDEKGAPIYPIPEAEWCEGNSAYDSLHADKFDESKSTDKENGLADTYGWRYIYEDGSDEENDEAKAFVEQQWKDFYKFVVTSSDEDFHAHLGDYCVLDSVLYYYLFTLRYTMTDNHAKNSFWHYGKSNDLDAEGNAIRKWDLCFDYDNDTALGIDNYGRMTYRYGYEEIDYVDGTQDWVWNAPQHVFFLRIRELFDAELCELYARLESEGCWSATSLINEFNEWQAQFPEELWRLDIQRKYIRTYTTSYINDKAYPEFLTERANGRKKSQRSQFERNQEKYMSSKFSGTVASADDIILRCSVPNTELAVQPNFNMHLTPYSHVYLNVKYNTAPPVRVRAVPNQEYTIEYTDALADIIEIYSASCLKSIGDLSACYLTNGTFAQATKIRELILGNGAEGYNNSNVMTLGLGSNELLNKLDIQNMSGLTHSLDLSGLKNLEELYAFGSGTSGVIFADGGNIKIAEIPDVGTLQMKSLNNLTDEGFEASSTYSLSRLVAEYSELDLIEMIKNSPNLRQVRLVGIDWDLPDASMLERLHGLAGVTNAGANAEQSVLTGTVRIPVIGSSELMKYNAAWPDLIIDPNTVIPQYKVIFVNDDGTIIEEQWINQFENATAPKTDPVKASSVQYDYVFNGWDGELTNITSNRTIVATYINVIRQYKIKYVSLNGTPIPGYEEPITGYYGENIPFEGEVPKYTAEEPYTYYLFKGWDKSGFLNGDFDEHGVKTVTAQFDSFMYNVSVLENLELSEMSPVQIYALTQKGLSNVSHKIEAGDRMSIKLGNDVEYSDVSSETIINEKTIFNGENHIDTGIKLFNEDRDFVLALDYELYEGNSANAVLAQCYQDNGSNGFRIWCNPSSDFTGAKFSWGTAVDNIASVNKREMLVIRHIKGENNLMIYKSTLDSDSVTSTVLERTKITTHDGTFVLGCAQPEKGYYENHAKGIVYWCKLWYSDLGETTCKELAEWTHEKLDFQVVDLSRRFYLSDNSGGRCSFTVLASNLLDRARAWNTISNTEGGWGSAKLNEVLNTRLYKALPVQIRSIIKQVKVPSSLGNKSTEVGTSDCYITIPSVFEVDASKNTSPYDSETMAGTFAIMGGIADRLRYYEDGTVGAYWLRSPDVGYTGYPWYVNESGVTTSFRGATNQLGVLIMLSF